MGSKWVIPENILEGEGRFLGLEKVRLQDAHNCYKNGNTFTNKRYLCSTFNRLFARSSHMVRNKLHSGTFKTKESQAGLVRNRLF